MRGLLRTLLFLLLPFAASAQYTNSWINYSQPYYKFPILQDGVYRITYTALVNSGIPVNSIDPDNIQMFGRGQELPIYVVGGQDGSLDSADYIEFHAQRNDGYFDREAYDIPENHGNPYYSLFNDTAFYFFSWGNTSGLRFQNITDTDINNITPATYFFKENSVYYTNSGYLFGKTYPIVNGATSPQYTAGEGYYSTSFSGAFTATVPTPSATTGPNATVKGNVVGLSDATHNMRISVGSFSFDTTYFGFYTKRYNKDIASSNISNGSTNVVYSSLSGTTHVAAYASVRYPHSMAVSGTTYPKMFVPDNANTGETKTLLNLTGFNLQGSTGRLFDLTTYKRVQLFTNGGATAALVPDGGVDKECYLTSDAQIAANSIQLLKPCGHNQDGYFLDITNYLVPPNFYIITHTSLWGEGQNYKAYRNLSGYNAELFDIDEIYDQFGHGIPKNPMSIRHFADFAYQEWPDTMQHLFLYGKGIYPYRCRADAAIYAACLVPTFGYPSCDMLLTAGLGGNLYEPAIPVGRVAARTPDQAQDYLDKVVEYEGAEPDEWKKRVLHFCGGADGAENELLCYYVDVMEEIIEDSLYGAWVQKFSKTNSQPFQITQADSIRNLIEDGVSLMTFFGHGAGGGFDVSTDDVNTYDNEGKYPLIFGNSCLSGDIHNIPGASLSMSEPWVLAEDRGAIGFLASVGNGVTGALARYGDSLYSNLGLKRYHYTIGQVMKNTVADVQSPGNYLYNFTVMQNTLHGDPGIRINTHPLPDLAISEPNVYFTNPDGNGTPITVTTELDSFDINIIVNNLGRTYDDTLTLYVRRTFPGGLDGGSITQTFAPIFFKDTLVVRFATNQIFGIGINQLYIHIDDGPFPVIDELSEQNNFINNMNFVVQSPDIIPVYPYKFAIMGEQGITLKASTGDPFAPVRTYRLQLDTTDRFNSPLMQETTITQSGGVVNWTPTLLASMPDSQVYFWRASVDSTVFKWRESSFQYIEDKWGWGQSHFFQFKPDTANYEGDKYNFVVHNRPGRRFDFINTPKSVSVHNIGWLSSVQEANQVLWNIDNELQDYIACGGSLAQLVQPQLIVAAIDNRTLEPWLTPGIEPSTGETVGLDHDFDQLNQCIGCCGRSRPWRMFLWQNNSDASMTNLATFLNTHVPDSFYVLIYSWIPGPSVGPATFVPWNSAPGNIAVKAALQNPPKFDFQALDTIPLNYPWAFFAQKGRPSTTSFLVGDAPNSIIDFQAQMNGIWNAGTITTPLIGPSAGWNWMYWDRHPSEIPTDDTMTVDIIGVRQNGVEEVVLSDYLIYPSTNPDSLSLTGIIDDAVHPYMKLQAFTQDDTTRTPVQLERWQIIYDQVPEAALNPNIGYYFPSSVVEQFQDIVFATAIENIGDYDMDSLLVKYWVQKQDNSSLIVPYPRQAPLLIDGVLIDTIHVSTADFVGTNKLWVEVNPYDSLGNPDQLEQYHFNNIGYVSFSANGDRINPILDVTFDGIHILDGDIVSAKPQIVARLDDENQYLIMDEYSDTNKIDVYVIYPDNSTHHIPWGGINGMIFTPASAPENICTIEYPAEFTTDGVYKLIVQGSDKSNNASGSFEYTISFEVINRSTITEVLNYPNPFSTSTRFVFVLTGSVIPDYFKIQIMTITGKVVREITTDELGPINIGRNITQYAWNGKDEYGDQLANGVYLYTVTAYINGQDIEHRATGADKYIRKNFGKMFLMR
ncbi:MAG: C25 family cysteine peptidase [Bacteroidia bacterium]